jgi:hypothetical protein
MPETVGSYQLTAFTTPALNSNLVSDVVRGNLNTARSSANSHDADAAIHLQSSVLASRPAPGVAGRKWFTSDERRLYFDTGTVWVEVAYVSTAGGTITGNVTLTGNLTVSGTITGTIDGASITGINATNITTGTLDGARFPATLPAANGAALTNLTGANVVGLTAAQVGEGTYPAGVYTYPGVLTAGGFTSTGRDRWTRTTGSATAGTYAVPATTNHHRVTIGHTSSVVLEFPSRTAGETGTLEVLQSSTPQSWSLGGAGMTFVLSNGASVLPTITANRKDILSYAYLTATEVFVVQTGQNIASTS